MPKYQGLDITPALERRDNNELGKPAKASVWISIVGLVVVISAAVATCVYKEPEEPTPEEQIEPNPTPSVPSESIGANASAA